MAGGLAEGRSLCGNGFVVAGEGGDESRRICAGLLNKSFGVSTRWRVFAVAIGIDPNGIRGTDDAG